MDEKLQSISIKITKHTRHKGKTVEPGKVLDDLDPAYAGEFLARGGLLYEGPNGEHLPASHVFDGTNWIPA